MYWLHLVRPCWLLPPFTLLSLASRFCFTHVSHQVRCSPRPFTFPFSHLAQRSDTSARNTFYTYLYIFIINSYHHIIRHSLFSRFLEKPHIVVHSFIKCPLHISSLYAYPRLAYHPHSFALVSPLWLTGHHWRTASLDVLYI